jgi:hypothetical protein
MFTWLAIHAEAAERLFRYETRQPELIALLDEMAAAGLNVIPSYGPSN